MTSTHAPGESRTLREAVIEQLYEIDALERDLIRRYEREEELLKMLARRDAEIKQLKSSEQGLKKSVQSVTAQRNQADALKDQVRRERDEARHERDEVCRERDEARRERDRAAGFEQRYEALSSSKLGSLQRRWWKLRSRRNA